MKERKLTSILVSFALVLLLLPALGGRALADGYGLYIGETVVTDENRSSDSHWTFTPKTDTAPNTLELNEFSYIGEGTSFNTNSEAYWSGILYEGSDPLTIILTGENSICVAKAGADLRALFSPFADITIKGSGILECITGGESQGNAGIDVKNLVVNGGTVKAVGGSATSRSAGIAGMSVTVNGGMVEAVGGTAGSESYGIDGAVTVTGGTLTARGGAVNSGDASYGIYGTVSIGENGSLNASGKGMAVSGTVKNAVPGIRWSSQEEYSISPNMETTWSDKNLCFPGEVYSLWIGGTRVTSLRQSGEKWKFTPKTDTAPNTLELNGFNYEGEGTEYNTSGGKYWSGILYSGSDPLTITLTGTNTISVAKANQYPCGIFGTGDATVTIAGSGSLKCETSGESSGSAGIEVQNLVVNGGTLTAAGGKASGRSTGISATTVTVNGGTVEATGGEAGSQSYGISGAVTVNGGILTAAGGTVNSGDASYGIYGTGTTSIGKSGQLNASGTGSAISGTVKNAVRGKGWTDVSGTGDPAIIAVSTDGQSLSSYRNVVFPDHLHSFTYTASGATITAVCGNSGCDISTGLEMTISEPASLVYDGSAKATTLNTDYSKTAFPGTYTAVYEQNGSAVDAADVKNAGIYTAKVTVEKATASLEFEIAKADPAVTAPEAKEDLVYTGSAQELVKAGSTADGTLYYAPGTDAAKAPADGWSTAVPKETKAGTYYVWYKLTGDGNHKDVDPACLTVKISENADQKAADAVIDLIDDLPAKDDVTPDDKDDIEAARKAYDGLTDDQKKLIPDDTLKKLTDAEDALADAEAEADKEAADKAAAKKVKDLIDGLPAKDDVTLDDKDDIEATRKAYDGLTDDQKKLIPDETLKKLTDAEDALADAEAEADKDVDDKAAAKKVKDLIDGLPAKDDVTLDDKDDIEAARKAYDGLTDDQKKLISDETLKKLTDAEAKYKELEEAAAKKPISITVTFKVVNGKWDDDKTKNDRIVTLKGFEGEDLFVQLDDIPDVGYSPDEQYEMGKWDTEPPLDKPITKNVTYTYTYAKKKTPAWIIYPQPVTPAKLAAQDPQEAVVGGLRYRLEPKTMTATVKGAQKKSAKTIVIPGSIKVNGKKYTVTAIREKAFRGMEKLTEATIGKNVVTIGAKAFYKCGKLKKLKIKTKHLTQETVGASAFGRTNKKMNITCPKGMKELYESILTGAGLSKKATFK